jgi:hypothetical protein
MLWEMIKDIQEPITFWLDSHSQLFEDEPDFGQRKFPLLMELRQIAKHPIKTHTILIDDLLVLTHGDVTGWTKHDIFEHVLAINPDYQFECIANPIRNNLLICSL